MRSTARTTKNRRILKTRTAAERRVPEILREWGDEIADKLSVAFDSENTAWSHDSITPNGDANYADSGYIRKTDAELERIEIHVHTSLAVDFQSGDAIPELIFNLKSLAAELDRIADSLADAEEGGEDNE